MDGTVISLIARSHEHIRLSKVKPKRIFVKDQLLLCNHTPSPDNFNVLANEDQKFCFKTMEKLLIQRDKSCLKNKISSAHMYLFDSV